MQSQPGLTTTSEASDTAEKKGLKATFATAAGDESNDVAVAAWIGCVGRDRAGSFDWRGLERAGDMKRQVSLFATQSRKRRSRSNSAD
jgi:hypothetical protein